MKDYKIKCLAILKNIQNELSDIRDEIEFDGDGYGSKLDKEAKVSKRRSINS